MHGNSIDLKGQRFGNVIALEPTDLKTPKKRGIVWKCLCDCGNICYKTSSDLRDKRRKTCSCGCMNKGNRKFPHNYVPKSHLSKIKQAQIRYGEELLASFIGADFYDELAEGIKKMNQIVMERKSENEQEI